MIFSILSLFPDMFEGPFSESIIKRAIDQKLVTINYGNIRDFATDAYKTVDDHPYGGGAGMILRVDVMERVLKRVKHSRIAGSSVKFKTRTILLDPRGKTYTQKKAVELSMFNHLILLCGHYEGVDERIRTLVDEEISIGDYVLTGGEIPAMVLVDSIVRLLPNVFKKPSATQFESFSPALATLHSPLSTLLEYPQYTRPPVWNNMKVPPVLLSGNHRKISDWQTRMAKKITKAHRPDLLAPSGQKDLVT